MAACGDDTAEVPRVIVPNEILGDLVRQVSCVEDVDVTVGEQVEGSSPILRITLDEPASNPVADDGAFVLSVATAAETISQLGEPDTWVWTDPIRFFEFSTSVAGALAQTGQFDPALLDRCVARIEAETAQLDEELFVVTQAVADEAREMAVSLPGAVYFANRYGFVASESDAGVRVARIISADHLGGAMSYSEMMRMRVDQIVGVLEP
jgi:ABC-type Zn uptake system ZnuABC Zn-binding protein ZnuA